MERTVLLLLYCLALLLGIPMVRAAATAVDAAAGVTPLAAAINEVFKLQSGAEGVSDHAPSVRRLTSLMLRQRIPTDVDVLRTLPDDELMRIAVVAAIGGMDGGPWKRDEDGGRLFLLDENGVLVHSVVPAAMESDVMLCLIIALLAVVVMQALASSPAPPAKPRP